MSKQAATSSISRRGNLFHSLRSMKNCAQPSGERGWWWRQGLERLAGKPSGQGGIRAIGRQRGSSERHLICKHCVPVSIKQPQQRPQPPPRPETHNTLIFVKGHKTNASEIKTAPAAQNKSRIVISSSEWIATERRKADEGKAIYKESKNMQICLLYELSLFRCIWISSLKMDISLP